MGQSDLVDISTLQPIVQPKALYVNDWRRKISGVNNKLLIRAEDEMLILSVANPDYAINPTLLRAVLNGFCIDMKVPCTKYEDEKIFGS